MHGRAIKIIIFLNLILSSVLQITNADSGNSFRGVVVEYGAKDSNKTSRDTVLWNVKSYKKIVETVKSKYPTIDIIVFPECGLTGISTTSTVKDIYGEEVPDPTQNVIPCNNDQSKSEAVRTLSCIAKNNAVYLVANLIEKLTENGETFIYNTNIAFSRTGSVIARYRKFNIYGYEGKPFHKTNKPDISYFDTDFGVRFGTFTCFDIDFKSPALDLVRNYNVTHIAFPTAWISELPHLTALQVQSGWAHSTNAVLLASGYNDPGRGSTGTGFYFGRLPFQESYDELTLQNQIKGDFAIISDVPKATNIGIFPVKTEIIYFYDTDEPEKEPLKLLRDHLHDFTTKAIEDSNGYSYVPNSYYSLMESVTEINKTVCDRGLCCEFVFKMKKNYRFDFFVKDPDFNGDAFGHYKYRLVAFNGVRSYGGGISTGGVQVCSIISCLYDDPESCGERTDNGDPATITSKTGLSYRQYFTTFYDVNIKAKLTSSDNTFVTSNIMSASNDIFPYLSSENLRFGKTVDSSAYKVKKLTQMDNSTAYYLLESNDFINNPASINLYNRLFDLDGKNATTYDDNNKNNTNNIDDDNNNKGDNNNSGSIFKITFMLFTISLIASFFV